MRTRWIFLAWLVMSAAPSHGFQRIVETGTVTPGVGVTFTSLGVPSIDHGHLAFCAQSYLNFGKDGFYRANEQGDVEVVANEQTPVPGGGTFPELCVDDATDEASVDGEDVAFFAFFTGGRGVFLHDGQSLTKVVDDAADFPDTDANELYWEAPSLDGRIAVTWGTQSVSQNFAGVYSFDGSTLFAVADTNVVPTNFYDVSDGTVSGPDDAPIMIDTGAYAFAARESPSGPYFVYRRRFGPLEPAELIAAANDPLPGDELLPSPHSPQMDRSDPERLCFLGGFTTGVYRWNGVATEIVADTETAIPGGSGSFTGFGPCAIDHGNVVFTGTGSGDQWGVYLGRSNGSLERVADTTTTFDGAVPTLLQSGREAISDGQITFRVVAGLEQSIWTTPEPGSALGAAAVLLALAGVGRRR